jgi:hypothetical protein
MKQKMGPGDSVSDLKLKDVNLWKLTASGQAYWKRWLRRCIKLQEHIKR